MSKRKAKSTFKMQLRKKKPTLKRAVSISEVLTAPAYSRSTRALVAGTAKKKSYKVMAAEAIKEVAKRGWASHAAIYKYIYTNYDVPENTFKGAVRRSLAKGEEEGIFERKNGRFFKLKVTNKKKKATKRKTTKKKTTTTKKTTAKRGRGRPPKSATKSTARGKKAAKKTARKKAKPLLRKTPSNIGFSKNKFKDRQPKSTGPDSGVTEIVFSFDCTGSMGQALAQAKTSIKETTKRLFSEVPDGRLRIGIVAHGDYSCGTEEQCMGYIDLTDDAKTINKFVTNANGRGGGDLPECYELILEQIQDFDWSEGSTRILVLIGDDQPHEKEVVKQQMATYMKGKCFGKPREIDWEEEADHLYEMGVKVYGVHANNRAYAGNFYRNVAARTCGTYVTLSDFKIVNDMILAICFREVSREKFMAFEKEVMAAKRMDSHRRRLFREVSGGLPEE